MRRLRVLAATALGVVAGGYLATGPVAAHEGSTATTVAVVTVGSSAGAAPAGEELPGVAEYRVPTPAMAGERRSDGWFDFAALVAATGVVAVAAAGALALSRRRGAGRVWPGRLQVGGAVALVFTGVAHCASAPAHFAEGWHLGAFFVASGLLLLGQAALVCVRPSQAAYRSVVASTVVLVALYVIGRQLTLPLVDHRDPYLLEDLPVKVAEVVAAGLAVAGLLALRRRGQPVSSETFGSAGAVSMSARSVPLPTGFSPSM